MRSKSPLLSGDTRFAGGAKLIALLLLPGARGRQRAKAAAMSRHNSPTPKDDAIERVPPWRYPHCPKLEQTSVYYPGLPMRAVFIQ
jgi:hypothetical protein